MRLAQLHKQWSYLSSYEKSEVVEKSNERRLEAFEIVKNKRSRKKTKSRSKSRKSSRSRSKTPKTAEGLMKLTEGMSKEEQENLKLFLLTQQKK